jgi:hypothetical protein
MNELFYMVVSCSSDSSWMYCRVLNWMSTDVSEVHAASIIRTMMEAAHTSETSVDIQLRTWQYIPEESELHTRRRENLKSHMVVSWFTQLRRQIFIALKLKSLEPACMLKFMNS